MILATSMPEYRATVTIKPVEEPMKIRSHYKKESVWSRTNCQILAVSWAFIMVGYLISLVWN